MAGARLADAHVAVVGSTRSGEHAHRARGHTARSAPPRTRRAGRSLLDPMLHGSTPPCRASAPPWSSTARAMSERPDLVSRSCPLRLFGSAHSDPAAASAAPGSRPPPSVSSRRPGSRAGGTRATARTHTRRSSRRPTRTDRTTPAPACTHDTDRTDRPRPAPARSGWTRAHNHRTLPRGSARPRAAAKARVVRPGPSPSPGCGSTSAPSALPELRVQQAPTPPRDPPGPPQAATGFQSPPSTPLHPPAPVELLEQPDPPLRRRCEDQSGESIGNRRRRRPC